MTPLLPSAPLLLPPPGDGTLRGLRRKVRLIALRRLLTQAGSGLPPSMARALPRLQRALVGSARAAGDAVLEAVGAPDVLPAVLAVESGAAAPSSLAAAIPSLLATLAGGPEGARRSALSEAVLWDHPFGVVVDGRTGAVLRFDPPARALLANPSGAEVELASARRVELDAAGGEAGVTEASAFHSCSADHPAMHLAEIDTNPLSLEEAHPDKSGNALDLGGRAASEWVASLAGALELVKLSLPSWYGELSVALTRLVPVGFEPERHLSASYREAPGIAYLTLHPDPLTLAEAIVHETQHGKLNLLTWTDRVLENGYTVFADSPVRPDKRPLMGVLLAVHAFVPVAAMHLALARAGHPIAEGPSFARRRDEVLDSNARGLEVVRERAAPTPAGRALLDDLGRLHEAVRGAW